MIVVALMLLRALTSGWRGRVADVAMLGVGAPAVIAMELAPLARSLQWSPVYLLLALAVFFVSVVLTTVEPASYWRSLGRALRRLPPRHHLRSAAWAGLTATYEEVAWRLAGQSMLCMTLRPGAAVLLVAAIFTFWHRQRTGTNLLLVCELFLFSLMQGWLFLVTSDLVLITLVHAVRNYLIGINGCTLEKV